MGTGCDAVWGRGLTLLRPDVALLGLGVSNLVRTGYDLVMAGGYPAVCVRVKGSDGGARCDPAQSKMGHFS